MEWVVECLITYSKPHFKVTKNPKEIKQLLGKYEKVFGDLSPGRPPDKGVEHAIELEIGTQPIKMNHYRHPKRIRYEIEESIK